MKKQPNTLGFIGLLVLFATNLYFKLYAVTKVWGYIAVPMGAHPIGLLQAWGLIILASMFVHYSPSEEKFESMEKIAKKLFGSMVQTVLSLGLAYWIFG